MAQDTFEEIGKHIEFVDKDEFLCQSCGEELFPNFVDYKMPFSKKELIDCEDGDQGDYSPVQEADYTNIIVSCSNCDEAKLSHDDIELLHGFCEELIVEGKAVMHDSVCL